MRKSRPRPLSRRGLWRTYTTEDGLAGLQVEHIAEDREGYLWFATYDSGVSRFDGEEFRTFTQGDGLSGNRVFAVCADRRGRIWFGTEGGICCYDACEFHRFGHIAAHATTQYIFEDREGRIWFGGSSVLGYCEEGEFVDLVPAYRRIYAQTPSHQWPMQCWGIAQDEEGHLWFGFDCLVRYDGESFHRFGERGDPFPRMRGLSYAVGRDGEGRLWVGGAQRLWRREEGKFNPVPIDLRGNVRKIQSDREGRLWIATQMGALCIDGDEVLHFSGRDGLVYNVVNAMLQDREGHFWFATWGGGACSYDPDSIHVFAGEEGLPQSEMSAVAEDAQGRIWMGFAALGEELEHPVFRHDGEGLHALGRAEGMELVNCLALCARADGSVWLGGVGALVRVLGRRFERVETQCEDGRLRVTALGESPEGVLFCGYQISSETDNYFDSFEKRVQLVRLDAEGERVLFEEVQEGEDAFNYISAIAVRGSEVWFGMGAVRDYGAGRGLGCWSAAGLRFYTREDGLADNRVAGLAADDQGRLWIATRGGLSCFDGRAFRNFTVEDGLPSNRATCAYEDRRGHLWFGTEGGVVHYDGRTFQSIRFPALLSVGGIVEDREGSFWFSTANGAIRYRPGRVPPRLRMLQAIADRIYSPDEKVEISTSTRQVVFEYKGASFRTHPRDMRYTFRLEGHEAEWQPPRRELRAAYRDLPPGEYTFQVRAIDRDLNYSEPARMALSVEPDPHIEALNRALSAEGAADEFVGKSPALRRVQVQLAQVAATELTVLIRGETGTGKGLAARAVHGMSPRAGGPFIQVNCGALPGGLVESELFGHERGAFTGAVIRKLGKVELARGGTLFLDEIGDLPLEAQVKLLRLLEEHLFERVGGTRTLETDARVIAASNRDLPHMVAAGEFRADLYFRLLPFPVQLPPLRERREDIPLLATFFMERMAMHLHKEVTRLEPEALALLRSYAWPGNVRELEHVVQRAVVLCREPLIRTEDIQLELGAAGSSVAEVLTLEENERHHLVRVLEHAGWVVAGAQGAAALLGVPVSTLRSRMKKLGIERPQS